MNKEKEKNMQQVYTVVVSINLLIYKTANEGQKNNCLYKYIVKCK